MLECGYFSDMRIFQILFSSHQKVGFLKKSRKSGISANMLLTGEKVGKGFPTFILEAFKL